MKCRIQTVTLIFCMFFTCSSAIASDFYVLLDSKQQGPVSMDQLQQMTSSGKVTKETMVWKEGMATWAKAGEQQVLESLFTEAASPPPLVQSSTPPPVPPSAPPVPPSNENSILQNDIDELNKMSDPKSVQSATDNMEDWFKGVFKQFNIQEGEDNGKFVVTASQSVLLKPTDPQYGDALVNAFDKAMMKLQESYVKYRFGRTMVNKTKSMFLDSSTNAREIALPPVQDLGFMNKALVVFEKGLDVTEKKLDKQLIELGTDPEELAKLTPTLKKDLFRNKFLKEILTEASGSIAGLFPIQTNVITDSKGRTSVGIVAIASQKSIQIAKDITLQRESLIQGKGRDIAKLLPKTEEEYLGTLGVRLAYDEDGSPAIVSYGIASYQPEGDDDYINDEISAIAKTSAESNANAQIAEIINGRMNVKNSQLTGEEKKKFVEMEMKPNADTIEREITNIVKISNDKAKSSASAKLQGISTIKKWRFTTKDGHKYVGAVRVWKYSTLRAVNAFNNPQSAQQTAAKKNQQFRNFQQESKPVNTKDDF